MPYIVALKDGGGLEKNWVYKVESENNERMVLLEEFTSPHNSLFEVKSNEVSVKKISKEDYNKLENHMYSNELDEFQEFLYKIVLK